MRRNICNAPNGIHIREAAEGESSRVIEGYAIVFNEPSEVLWDLGDEIAREVIAPEAVTKELLDSCDIKFTMYHNREILLARSNKGEGTLTYKVDEKGVYFSFEAPNTPDGDTALELVRLRIISGCSFAFSARYGDPACVSRDAVTIDGVVNVTYTVRQIEAIYDMTLAADPAYPQTSVTSERETVEMLYKSIHEKENNYREQVSEMRRAAAKLI